MKTCRDCCAEKPLAEFYAHPRTGPASDCKDCARAKARERMRRKRQDDDYRQRERDAQAVFREANPDRVREARQRAKQALGLTDRSDQMPAFDLAKPITYDTAHYRVARWRGRASIHQCACGATARSWAYRKDSPHEQVGVTHTKYGDIEVRFSPDPMDYDPMCQSCHTQFDVKNRARDFLLLRG